MQRLEYPFDSSMFNSKTSVLLDACFLLSISNEEDPKYGQCIETYKQLQTSKCSLYVTTIVWAEVLNVVMNKLFIQDIRYKLDNNNPINNKCNISLIIKHFTAYHRKHLNNYKKSCNIPYKKYFNIIYKNKNERDLLKIYFVKSVEIQKLLEKSLLIKHVSLNKASFEQAREYVEKYQLCLNDATHLSAAEQCKITYLLTLDGDFNNEISANTRLLKI